MQASAQDFSAFRMQQLVNELAEVVGREQSLEFAGTMQRMEREELLEVRHALGVVRRALLHS